MSAKATILYNELENFTLKITVTSSRPNSYLFIYTYEIPLQVNITDNII